MKIVGFPTRGWVPAPSTVSVNTTEVPPAVPRVRVTPVAPVPVEAVIPGMPEEVLQLVPPALANVAVDVPLNANIRLA